MKPRENSNFLKNGKMVILVKIRNFSRSQMKKRTSPLESSHEIWLPCRISSKIRDSRNFHILQETGITRDTWHILSGSRGAMCHVQN